MTITIAWKKILLSLLKSYFFLQNNWNKFKKCLELWITLYLGVSITSHFCRYFCFSWNGDVFYMTFMCTTFQNSSHIQKNEKNSQFLFLSLICFFHCKHSLISNKNASSFLCLPTEVLYDRSVCGEVYLLFTSDNSVPSKSQFYYIGWFL